MVIISFKIILDYSIKHSEFRSRAEFLTNIMNLLIIAIWFIFLGWWCHKKRWKWQNSNIFSIRETAKTSQFQKLNQIGPIPKLRLTTINKKIEQLLSCIRFCVPICAYRDYITTPIIVFDGYDKKMSLYCASRFVMETTERSLPFYLSRSEILSDKYYCRFSLTSTTRFSSTHHGLWFFR